MNLSVIPECYVDKNLVETLVPPAKENNQHGYNHQHRCGTVTKVMQEKFQDAFALGIIDKDKHEVDYLKHFDIVITSGALLLHKHKTKHHYIIQISPVIERMILINAAAVGLNLEDYGLYSDFEKLKKQSKTNTSNKDIRFTNLFKALNKNSAPDIKKLAAWIVYLKENNYNADIDVIKNL